MGKEGCEEVWRNKGTQGSGNRSPRPYHRDVVGGRKGHHGKLQGLGICSTVALNFIYKNTHPKIKNFKTVTTEH